MKLNYFQLPNFLLLIVIINLYSCQDSDSIKTQTNANLPNICTDSPTTTLTKTEIITLSNQPSIISGQIKNGKDIGYEFVGKAQQKLKYQIEDPDICLWLYTPDGKQLNNLTLPMDGKYIIQLSTTKGATTVELTIRLEDENDAIAKNTLTEAEAIKIVEQWHQAKHKIFASPFYSKLAEKYTTATALDNTRGAMDWLRHWNCYYTYDSISIDQLISFQNSQSQPSLTLRVTEKSVLDGECIREKSSLVSEITYLFQQDNQIWKIAEIVNPNLLELNEDKLNRVQSHSPDINNNYDWLSNREVTQSDLKNKTARELSLMRNSIFARKGRKFNNYQLQEYFNQQLWYQPLYSPEEFSSNSLLSPLEKRNASYILDYQNTNNLIWIK